MVFSVIRDLCRGSAKINPQHLHASDDSQSRLQDVAIDDGSEFQLFLFCVTALMQNPVHKSRALAISKQTTPPHFVLSRIPLVIANMNVKSHVHTNS